MAEEVDVTFDDLHSTYYKEDNPNEWLLVKYHVPLVCVVVYLWVVWRGPRWMECRPAFRLHTALRVYDIIQILFNMWMLLGYFIVPGSPTMVFEKSCKLDTKEVQRFIRGDYDHLREMYDYYNWCFILLKMVDLIDTIFMVARKKNSHMTFLHIYHHAAMVVIPFFLFKYARAIQSCVIATINTIVHLIMYSYYFLSTFGPLVQKHLWWKKHLTKLQLGQFVIIILYLVSQYYQGCKLPKPFLYICLCNATLFIVLFTNFYWKTYVSSRLNGINETKMS